MTSKADLRKAITAHTQLSEATTDLYARMKKVNLCEELSRRMALVVDYATQANLLRGEKDMLASELSQERTRLQREENTVEQFVLANDELQREKLDLATQLRTAQEKNRELSIRHDADQAIINRMKEHRNTTGRQLEVFERALANIESTSDVVVAMNQAMRMIFYGEERKRA